MLVPVAGAVGGAVLLLVLLVVLLHRPRTDIDRFAAARALTTRWAADATGPTGNDDPARGRRAEPSS